tara:strand:+ start:693 stop:1388 length:696 start_codon:yes stop_codon:yes gene_type:complete
MKIENAIILAAGRGIRMMPLSKNIPKPMIKINGQSLIERGIENINKKIKNVYITVGYKSSKLSAHVINKGTRAILNTEGKGNSWWIYKSLLSKTNEPVLVLTCDNLFKLDYNFIVKEYRRLNMPECLIFPVKPVKSCNGDYITKKKNKIVNLSRNNKTNLYASGIQIINPYRVNKITSFSNSFNKLWKQLIKKNKLYLSNMYPGEWYAIDNLKNLNDVKKNKKLKNYFFKK